MSQNILKYPAILVLTFLIVCQNSPVEHVVDEEIQIRELGKDYDYIYCLASGTEVDRHIPVPDFKGLLSKGSGTLGDFEVRYNGFTPEAQDAFQYAVDIWDMLLESDATIVVNATFQDLDSGVLGSASPTRMYANFSDKVDANIEFAAPLADKIAGFSLNATGADLNCNFSSAANWYYDFDNPDLIGSGQHDFVSVVLHELGHGLGFLSRYTFATDNAGFIRGGAPVETDVFSLLLERGNGDNLILNLEEGSSELELALTSDDVFLNTHTLPKSSKELLPEIYAPAIWNSGSSLSHLDEASFNVSDPLMTPFIATREILHDPQIALTMMNDMGWSSSFIAHRREPSESEGTAIPIEANIFTDDGVGFDSTKVQLVYSQDSFRISADTLPMTASLGSSLFSAALPADNNTGRYQYAIILNDSINRGYSSPLLSPRRYHDIPVGLDEEGPTISHQPVALYFLGDGEPVISATVADAFTGLDEVFVEFQVNGGPIKTFNLPQDQFDIYSSVFDLEAERVTVDDCINYRIVANDRANNQNTSFFPTTGFQEIKVKGIPGVVTTYLNDFNESSTDFTAEDFSIRTESGFDDGALHSEHPYDNAGTGNELNFIARLRVPIEVISEGKIEFDEAVLVEPGEAGTGFGDDEFWDYVIVEASKNGGLSWIPLVDGYDSGDRPEWNTRYNNGLSGQTSTSSADEALLFNRSFLLHQPSLGIEVGDQVILRWRLFSDAFATGWGWIIDNLEIQNQDTTTPIAEVDEVDAIISVFPNPIISDQFRFSVQGDVSINQVKIFDASGKLVNSFILKASQNEERSFNISDLDSGIYYALFTVDDGLVTKPFIKL